MKNGKKALVYYVGRCWSCIQHVGVIDKWPSPRAGSNGDRQLIFPAAFLTAESTSEGCRKRPVNGPIVCQLFRWDVATDYRDK